MIVPCRQPAPPEHVARCAGAAYRPGRDRGCPCGSECEPEPFGAAEDLAATAAGRHRH